MARRWIRLDATWEDSEWLDALDGAAAGCWPRVLCMVKRDGIGGRCKRPSHAVAARRWRVPVEAIQTLEDAAIADGALKIEDGDWIVTGWAEYQDVDPTAAIRKRRERAKKKEAEPVTRDTRDTGRDLSCATETETMTDIQKDANASSVRFEEFWAHYPKRTGGNPKKRARTAWNARIKEGADPDAIIRGRNRYTAYLRAEGKVGTKYVMQAATFLGPDCRFAEDWTAEPATKKPTPQQYDYSNATTEFKGFGP